jgi:hypothetical protein
MKNITASKFPFQKNPIIKPPITIPTKYKMPRIIILFLFLSISVINEKWNNNIF